MRTIIIILICAASFSVRAQQILDIAAPAETGGNYGTINFLDMSELGHKKVENIPYSDIQGSPFWDDKWNSALLFLSGNRKAKVQKAKLDLYANEIRFIDKDGKEFSLDNTTVLKVIFFKGGDSTTKLAAFESLPDSLNPAKYSYYQVLNNGKYKLLELKKSLVKENEYNPTTGTNEHSFFSKTSYAISDGENITLIKLNQSSVLSFIHPKENAYTWLSENKNKLKSILEIVSFLDYYNNSIKQ
jgi:hypothetical protein